MGSYQETMPFATRKVTQTDLINHLFLPKKLPQTEDQYLTKIELEILEHAYSVTQTLFKDHGLVKTGQLFKTWLEIQTNPASITNSLKTLQIADHACFYVRKQNCTIHFKKLDHEHMRVLTFRSSLPNEKIVGTCGSIKVTHPETFDVVPISSLLLSPCLANQLAHLSSNICSIAMPKSYKARCEFPETREPSHPYIISDFLVSMLCPLSREECEKFGKLEQIQFEKKLRDQVNWSKKALFPWRRSGLWTSIKVTLQLSLLEEFKCRKAAQILYKVLLLEILTSLAEKYSKEEAGTWDIHAQIMAKLARRSKKLFESMTTIQVLSIQQQIDKSLKRCWAIIDKIHAKVSTQWTEAVSTKEQALQVNLICRDAQKWKKDCLHHINELTDYLGSNRIPDNFGEKIDNLKNIDPVAQISTVTLESLLKQFNDGLKTEKQDVHLNDSAVWLYRVEWFVRNRLEVSQNCKQISDLMFAYIETAFPVYTIDPVCYSRLTITILKFVAVLDEIAVSRHSLLKEYKTGIQPEMFECLLIPEKADMLLVEELQNYFRQRNSKALCAEWLESSFITENDFCVKFAQTNGAMLRLKKQILQKMKRDMEAKQREVQMAKERCNNLQKRISPLTCTYTWNFYRERTEHSGSCLRCSLKCELEYERHSVNCMQRPLPPEDYLRDAVCFELLIPEELALLRDSVTTLLTDVLGYRKKTLCPKIENFEEQWTKFQELNAFDKTGHQNLCHLVSTTKSILRSHYGANPDVLTNHESAFVLENGLNCFYHRKPVNTSPEKPFTCKIKTAEEEEAYSCLQFALETRRATENEVIAKQYDCHQHVTLKEFKQFGCLRSGQKVSLRNLYAEIASKTLSLEKEPVFQLILQTIWQLGAGNREAHVDFECQENREFALAFLELLRNTGRENASNWSNPVLFMCLGVITIRILELSDDAEVKQEAGNILQGYRNNLDDWCSKLEGFLVESDNQKDTQVLMQLLLKSAISCALTFSVASSSNLFHIFQTSSDIENFLKCLSRLHYLVIRENILKENHPSIFMQNLLRHARLTIPLNVQEYLSNSKQLNSALHSFTCSNWVDAKEFANFAKFKQENCNVLKKHAYQATYTISGQNHSVCVDILRGTFFVDGLPPQHLPEEIIRHSLFKSFFQTSQFNVQRVGGTFTTTNMYRGYHFKFTEVGDKLIIRQLTSNEQFYELIPPEKLKENVADDLIYNYTHWFCSMSKQIYFRGPLANTECQTSSVQEDSDYVLVPCSVYTRTKIPDAWQLCKKTSSERSNSSMLLSIKSNGFQKITQNLRKLEHQDYIHVVNTDSQISANLWRLNLTFTLDENDGLLYCDNYPGYYIPVSNSGGQNLQTLVGLKSGIVLEKVSNAEASGKKRMFLIQHGGISIRNKYPEDEADEEEEENKTKQDRIGDPDEVDEEEFLPQGQHQSVKVAVDGLRNPPYFVYEVDQILKRLRPGNDKSAWLYLALLHGATSSPFPDPFTGLTGTEAAMWILQSGFVWSCSPYNEECKKTLRRIANLSPQYKYYPEQMKVMQTIKWPRGLSHCSYAAYDGYAILVEKLFQDSTRLGALFNAGFSEHTKRGLALCKRSYFRNVNMYNKAVHLASEFLEPSSVQSFEEFFLPTKLQSCNKEYLTTLAYFRKNRIVASTTQTIASLILTEDPLPSTFESKMTRLCVPSWLETKFRNNWLYLYSVAQNPQEEIMINDKTEVVDRTHELTLILGAILYSGKGLLEQLLNLHNINIRNESFLVAPESTTCLPFAPVNTEFVNETIQQILQEAANPAPAEGPEYDTQAKYLNALEVYSCALKRQTTGCAEHLKTLHWPCKTVTCAELSHIVNGNHLLNCGTEVLDKINRKLKNWFNNLTLKRFIFDCDLKLGQLQSEKHPDTKLKHQETYCRAIPDNSDTWQDSISARSRTTIDRAALEIANTGDFKATHVHSVICYSSCRKECAGLCRTFTNALQTLVVGDCPSVKALDKARLQQILVPIYLLRKQYANIDNIAISGYARALAVLWAYQKRLNRLIMYSSDSEKFAVELKRETETQPCANWNPLKNPEFLLLELELDLTIRPIQVDVARQMINMPNGENGVMQLNMGEGKTSVIIPMIVAATTSKDNSLCRVTVLGSIFATNYNLLSSTIGGFLNKRVYTVPCNREIKDFPKYLSAIQETYDECLKLKGAAITLPEYRLSFRLQTYNYFSQKDMQCVGKQVYEIESWLRNNVRDFVDESDEIFSVKYQLIYTTGILKQQIDGGSIRWQVCQKLLGYMSQVASQLLEEYEIEFQPDEALRNLDQFAHFRIIDDNCKTTFYEKVVEGIFNGGVNLIGGVLGQDKREIIREFLLNENISQENHKKFSKLDLTKDDKDMLLLTSGYIRRGVLFSALKKRWRVEYGVRVPKTGSKPKLMAVPFRAKDVAAERTEFGHPDMAIVLTQLSYYYSGLTDEQLKECFKVLESKMPGSAGIYASWIAHIPQNKIERVCEEERQQPSINENISSDWWDTVSQYNGVNLQAYRQRTYLFKLLRKNTKVVDFWLENVVFPKECKQFPNKLVTNANDLCYHKNTHATTGFSGTNDTSLLLPSQITQQDLESLRRTNEEMKETLRGEENTYKRSLEMGVGCKRILQFMKDDKLQVLIDAGALMLEWGNERIAEEWLKLDSSLEAAIYFDDKGNLSVKARLANKTRKRHEDTLLTLSSFRDRLDKCAIYLDDQHTRGTDIKLPTNFKACVTVGSRMRKDKLIQACMRMRKLGKGQSVHFYLSHEVRNKISRKVVDVASIIEWTEENSRQFEKEGLVHWATNAKTYAKNLAADDLYELSGKNDNDGIVLAKRVQDKDAQTLEQMYGKYLERVDLVSLIPEWFSKILGKLNNVETLPENFVKTDEMLENLGNTVLDKIKKHIPDEKFSHSKLDEEQEKELEPDHQAEVEKYRPPEETPIKPKLLDNVKHCVLYKNEICEMEGILRLSDIFQNTTVWPLVQPDCWGGQWFATTDFIETIEQTCALKHDDHMDYFLKGIRFFVTFQHGKMGLLLSIFEVDKLIACFRERRCLEGTTLHMFSGRWMLDQLTFSNDRKLQLPLRNKPARVSLDENTLAPVLIAAGNLFFESMQEQIAFARFLGIRPREWTDEEQNAFQNGWITSTGFVCPNTIPREGCNFQQDPTVLVSAILKLRNDVQRESDHVVKLLKTVSYINLKDKEENNA